MKTTVRPTAVAGTFYTDDPKLLFTEISSLLEGNTSTFEHQLKACIVPHAGLQYSGSTAACIYSIIKNQKNRFENVLLMGPSHHVSFRGIAAPSVLRFATPFGDIPVNTTLIKTLSQLPFFVVSDKPHEYEHCIEIQLPFLYQIFEKITITPLVFSSASQDEAAQILEIAINLPKTLLLISSDLSHYHDYDTAVKIDNNTSKLIEILSTQPLSDDQACGSTAINGLIKLARNKNFGVKKIAQCNSGDISGDKTRVVGYAGYVFF